MIEEQFTDDAPKYETAYQKAVKAGYDLKGFLSDEEIEKFPSEYIRSELLILNEMQLAGQENRIKPEEQMFEDYPARDLYYNAIILENFGQYLESKMQRWEQELKIALGLHEPAYEASDDPQPNLTQFSQETLLDLAKSPNPLVREQLASAGVLPHIFKYDPVAEVRLATLQACGEYADCWREKERNPVMIKALIKHGVGLDFYSNLDPQFKVMVENQIKLNDLINYIENEDTEALMEVFLDYQLVILANTRKFSTELIDTAHKAIRFLHLFIQNHHEPLNQE